MERTELDPLIRAIGGTLGIFGALLERANVATLEEIAGTLGVYGAVTNETDPDQGAIIGQWVVSLLELASNQYRQN